MISKNELYKFLVTAADTTDLPLPPSAINNPVNTGQLTEDGRIEDIRTRLLSLIGTTTKQASREDDVDLVFGKVPGEPDPTAESLSPEYEELLRSILEKGREDAPSKPIGTVSMRPKRSM
jgi:hypothetical protein